MRYIHASTRISGGFGHRIFYGLLIFFLVFSTMARAAELLNFENIYLSSGILGMKFSPLAKSSVGRVVRMKGFMAPPLKPDSRFFVLTRQPVAICPFCSSDAEWPMDIVVVYLKGDYSPTNFSEKITVEGTLELGSSTDPSSGFVSQVRIINATLRTP